MGLLMMRTLLLLWWAIDHVIGRMRPFRRVFIEAVPSTLSMLLRLIVGRGTVLLLSAVSFSKGRKVSIG